MNRRDSRFYLFSLLLIVVGAFVVFDGYPRDGYHLIAMGAVISVILRLTGGRNGNQRQ